ncbi:MAG TPA: DUF262 domain-containing HNH endonuclease family protein [Candidatus Mediterraneibacter faecipullorum]|uniref:DUF262 domain-containing HNH endonuclease family protein n=1 Tax=Candidatus Mediterraneibacter faecipullorum TaxID=2838670 RepID=A0A9D2NJI5_9FIRM|nr:DUF262 domain-containing HNH endonuclease family protein [Candidatus Mediterraneibacter faecipullorum]
MATTIEVNKQSVKQLLETGKEHPFVIPEYQRPYAWGCDEVQTLFDDLWDFTTSEGGGTDGNSTYFLGTIVSYENEHGEQEIIDGQQRITSLFLLLRAIYTSLQRIPDKSKEAKNFISQIEPALWRTDKLTGEVNFADILLKSKVLNNEGNEILKKILATGVTDPKAKDNYSKNYIKLQTLFAEASKTNPLMIYEFIYVVLNKAIILPITADTQDTALTIFSTLNDRGLPLSDADIFKAKIYNHLSSDEKTEFINKWKELDELAADVGESIQQLFYYYMFYLRAVEKDNNTTTPGIRKFYEGGENKYERLYQPELIDNLFVIVKLWSVVNKHEEYEDEKWTTDSDVLKALDILSAYPNEFWKYPVIIFYLTHRNEEDFANQFSKFLHKLIKELLTKYLLAPTINAVKSDILKLNVEIVSSTSPKFDFKPIDLAQLKDEIRTPHRNAVRMLLKILAYEKQDKLFPEKWEIEHIFPKKWQTNYFLNISDEVISEKVEHLGNKLPFEKRLNIIAGNGYFKKKQKEYAKSEIAITSSMSSLQFADWGLDDIAERDVRVSDEIIAILKRWDDEYRTASIPNVESGLSEEERAMLEKFKQMGLVK